MTPTLRTVHELALIVQKLRAIVVFHQFEKLMQLRESIE